MNGNEIHLPEQYVQEKGLDEKLVTLGHVKMLQGFQQTQVLKLAPGLRESVTNPGHFKKMSVAEALEFFSDATAHGLEYLSSKENQPELLTTATFIKDVRRWFNLMTSRELIYALGLKDPEKYDQAVEWLRSFIEVVKTMEVGKAQQKKWKPFQSGIILSTTSLLQIVEQLLDQGFQFVYTSRFTQDALENFFSLLR